LLIFGVLEIPVDKKALYHSLIEEAALPTLKLGAVCVQHLVSIVCVCMTPINEFHITDPLECQTEKGDLHNIAVNVQQ